MALRLENGDYVKTAFHDLEQLTAAEEEAQRLLLRLRARRGGFALLPEYGSRLYMLPSKKPGDRVLCARQYIAEALNGENAVLEDLHIREQGDSLLLEIELRCGDGQISITTEV